MNTTFLFARAFVQKDVLAAVPGLSAANLTQWMARDVLELGIPAPGAGYPRRFSAVDTIKVAIVHHVNCLGIPPNAAAKHVCGSAEERIRRVIQMLEVAHSDLAPGEKPDYSFGEDNYRLAIYHDDMGLCFQALCRDDTMRTVDPARCERTDIVWPPRAHIEVCVDDIIFDVLKRLELGRLLQDVA